MRCLEPMTRWVAVQKNLNLSGTAEFAVSHMCAVLVLLWETALCEMKKLKTHFAWDV